MTRIYLDSKAVPDWFRVKVLAASAPVGGSIVRYWFEDRRHYAEIRVAAIKRPLLARTADCPDCDGFGYSGDVDGDNCQRCDSTGRVERLEIVGRDNDGREFITRFETDDETQGDDAGGDALGLLQPALFDKARWDA